MKCTTKKFSDEKLCVSDLRNFLSVFDRQIKGDHPDIATIATTDLVPVLEVWAACKTVNAWQQAQNVDSDRKVTHKFYVRALDWTIQFDKQKHFIKSTENYRIHDIENVNEQNQIIVLNCERIGQGIGAVS
jgi:Phage head-tail joining protein